MVRHEGFPEFLGGVCAFLVLNTYLVMFGAPCTPRPHGPLRRQGSGISNHHPLQYVGTGRGGAVCEIRDLALCTASFGIRGQLTIPEATLSQWGAHRVFGPVLQELLQTAQTVLGYDQPVESNGTPQKRRPELAGGAGGTPAKRAKIDATDVVKTDSLTEALVVTVPMTNVKAGVVVEIRMGHSVCISNKSDKPVQLKAGLMVCSS